MVRKDPVKGPNNCIMQNNLSIKTKYTCTWPFSQNLFAITFHQ